MNPVHDLRARFATDGADGAVVQRWVVGLSMSTMAHGWSLVQAIGAQSKSVGGAPATADKIIQTLVDHSLLTRGKRELWYAPEILCFGVGGQPGHQLERAEYPCLFTWSPTPLLTQLVARNNQRPGNADLAAAIGEIFTAAEERAVLPEQHHFELVPPFKQVGGKRKLAERIAQELPQKIVKYAEVFAGGAALLCEVANQGRLVNGAGVFLNDLEPGVAAVFEALDRGASALGQSLAVRREQYEKLSPERREQTYYEERDLWNAGEKIARRFMFLKATSFNGLWRLNMDGELNAAWNKSTTFADHEEDLAAWDVWLSGNAVRLDVRNEDFRKCGVLEWFETELPWDPIVGASVAFLDPPYVETFAAYSADGFGHQDQIDVLLLAHQLRLHGAWVAWTNSPAAEPLTRFFADPKKLITLDTTYNVNCDGAGRSGQQELLVIAPPLR